MHRVETGMDGIRDKVRSKFHTILRDETKAKHLEICLYNWTWDACHRDRQPQFWTNPVFRYRYTTRAWGLMFNLQHPKNPDLGDRVRKGEVSIKTYANMSAEQMFPQLYAPIYERLASKELRRMAISHSDAPDGAYTCNRCKSKKTQYTCLQTRSADEPMSIFVSCLQCGKRWRG